MKVVDAVAHILKQEGVENLICYPRQPLIDACARVDIRPVVCRQERVGVGLADGISRSTYGKKIGVFSMQGGPGVENTFPGAAQVFGDNVPVLLISGDRVGRSFTPPSFDPVQVFKPVTKWTAEINDPARVSEIMRRAFQNLRSGKPGPVLLELPSNIGNLDLPGELDYKPVGAVRSGPDALDIRRAVELLMKARCPIIHAGQGVLYAGATAELVKLAEALQIPVLTTNTGKGAFPENHPLSLGAAVVSAPKAVFDYIRNADLIVAMGSSLTRNHWAPQVPVGKRIIHCTNDPADLNKEFPYDVAVLGDARLTIQAFLDEIGSKRRTSEDIAAGVRSAKDKWLEEWRSELTSNEVPINQYRIIHDLKSTIDPATAILTHESGSPREQLVTFWECVQPGGYLGWGKTTQLGHGLGLIMGAKLANPGKTCINLMGDASIGMVGMDIETAVRNKLGILTIVFNNGVMAGEQNGLLDAVQKYEAANLTGNYSMVAKGLGAWSTRIDAPDQFLPKLEEALAATRAGTPALIECVAKQNFRYSRY
ncbi:thiamine pyrophosphate-requiring protein [Roseiarcaceae bacterium H3SJ34-1]|uniref:thiamine pyrophosphate-requiring protein n=1 Tax=Terripilifer ovatus TaxID=3032367 RepID=UPI003AB95460|nr:thiamine pyrophosphate-requiring protein [Roseiarcaceae bacterium H3SJ34-1]